ncbi:epoxide hydrolase family protein [Amycolatopsis magusensis]|uniref:Pimeloyl-ACP methyl ester carboxylesterase n=1 Tax=Amycolatopsis magusensis TaxID=882444 RepID=A0ABS4PMR9_9PSEU|nr:epoxide hydrolase family protein [Amycolatopsis magusensis]MBP2180707.1 pimeloyl-ACP methyl ester carboxylesterase [Amycolatopsis magusensis]
MSTEIKPFRIEIPQADLDDLRERLAHTRWPKQLPGDGWDRGVPVDYLRELAEYWRNGFDWRAQEARFNEFPQFLTEIDGQPIHFFHLRSSKPDALPLLLTHSWPNSIAEFTELLGPLSEDFHVIAPSLPGFGFSPLAEPEWSLEKVAVTWAKLMSRLGYERYGVHGNDAGALVSPQIALVDAEHLVGVHITGGLGITLEMMAEWGVGGSGYAEYLAARPQTLAYGWHDSPVAQLAFLVERFKEFDGWHQAGSTEPIDRDLILTNASVYWLTETGASSAWPYYTGGAGLPIDQALVPTGVSHGGPDEVRKLAEAKNDIVHWASRDAGSHMIAMANPETILADLREFFGKLDELRLVVEPAPVPGGRERGLDHRVVGEQAISS